MSKQWQPCNVKAFRHWQECRAVNQFPDDAIVRRHAALLLEVEDTLRDRRQERIWSAVAGAIS